VRFRQPILIAAFVLGATVSAGTAELTDVDRQRLVAHLDMTASWFVDEVSNLSQSRLDFRRAPGSWTIMEVIEHLVIVGPIYWKDLQTAAQAPPSGRLLSSRDADILWYGIDRSHRETALASETAKGQLRDLRAGLAAYRKQHAQLLQYAKTTKDDLRDRYVDRQGCDAYQWALLISTHEQRHILQIREIKTDPNFPKK
jgi:DinB family protein